MADKDNQNSQPRPILGLVFILMGLWPMLAAFDLGPLGSDKINGPPMLGLAAGGIFITAGLKLALGDRLPSAGGLLVLLIVAGLATIGNWVAFGSGERVCDGSISLPFFDSSWLSTDLACRIPFGFGAVVLNAMLFLTLINFLERTLGGSPGLARLARLAQGLLFISLAPLLIPLLLILSAKSFLVALRARLTDGAWPRNESFIGRMRKKRESV